MKVFKIIFFIIILFIISAFLTVEVAQCQSKEIHFFGEKILVKENPDFDGWTLAHITGGFVIYEGLGIFTDNSETKFWATVVLGFAYEYYCDGLKNPIFPGHGVDPGGADFVGDTSAVLIGASLRYICDKLNQLTKSKALAVDRRGLTVSFNL